MNKPLKMIIIWGSETIFGSSLQNLLAPRSDWNVVGVRNLEEFDSLIVPLQLNGPQIVIVLQAELGEGSDMYLQLLQRRSNLRLITVSTQNNMLNIYSKRTLQIKETADLISAIESDDRRS